MLSYRSLAGTFLLCALASTAVAKENAGSILSSSDIPSASTTVKGVPQGVEFFAAIQNGTIDVKFIPRDETRGRVIIKNNTKQPVKLRLPEAFAGVPVLAQIGGGGFGGGGLGGGGLGGAGGGGSQGVGGGFGGGGGGLGGGGLGGGGGGVFNVAPEKTHRLDVKTVCLEHGKDDPNPRIPYELKPLESFVKRPAVIELVRAYGTGKLGYDVAQAAAWHLNNDLSWEELAHKTRGMRHPATGRRPPYFSARQIHAAMKIAEEAHRYAEKLKKEGKKYPYAEKEASPIKDS